MTDIDIVAELRRLYATAIQHAGDLDETASVLALNIAVVHHLPALLDAIDALRWYADIFNYDDDDCPVTTFYHPDGDMDCEADRGTKAREALAALERSGE